MRVAAFPQTARREQHSRSAKGAAARHQSKSELASPLGGAFDTATVLREFLRRTRKFATFHIECPFNDSFVCLTFISGKLWPCSNAIDRKRLVIQAAVRESNVQIEAVHGCNKT
jgi:hypothetical protein